MGLLLYMVLPVVIPCIIAVLLILLIRKVVAYLSKGKQLKTGILWIAGFFIWLSVFLLGTHPIVICPPELQPAVTEEMKADIIDRVSTNTALMPDYVIVITDAEYIEYAGSDVTETYIEGYSVQLLTKVYGSLRRYGQNQTSAGWSEFLFS